MSLRRYLRKRDSRRLKLELLRNQHPGSEFTEFSSPERYLQLLLEDKQGSRGQAWFSVDAWLRNMDAHLPDIPWSEVPLSYLARWLKHLGLIFLVQEQVWDVVQISLPENTLPDTALAIPAEPCPLLCLDWPENEGNESYVPTISACQVPFHLKYVLGYSQFTLGELVDVAPRDLLLIKEDFAHLAINGQRLFKIRFKKNLEVIMEKQLEEHDQEYFEEDILHEWTSLPVNIEFVLDGQSLTLAELDGITSGMSLALPPEAEQNIKIYLNKALFARGELVALENDSLAVEINHVYPIYLGNRVQSDVE